MERKEVVTHTINCEKNVVDSITEEVLSICDTAHLMPDTHIGKSVPIGFVGKLKPNRIIPEMVGVDIGCGMSAFKIDKSWQIDLDKLHDVISKSIPTGNQVRKTLTYSGREYKHILKGLKMPTTSKMIDRWQHSLGTLGGGNHFIELNEFDDFYLLVVHSGSRNLGATICDYYTKTFLSSYFDEKGMKKAIDEIKAKYPKEEREEKLKVIKKENFIIKQDYLKGKNLENYLYDMDIALIYAKLNREEMLVDIVNGLGIDENDLSYVLSVPHNYFDKATNTIYKGAINAKKGKEVIIPINMRDGVILGVGKGNEDWLCGCPHGAGRVKSRRKAKEDLTLEDMKRQMANVYSKTINNNTLDEHPDAYRNIEEILAVVGETITDIKIGKVLYNFKGDQ
ncbi:MAG: RtcB family protein [Oscillospiraceae bacterium]